MLTGFAARTYKAILRFACYGNSADLAAAVVNSQVEYGSSMPRHLPNLSVGAALPQQNVSLQASAGTQAEGLAVCKAVHPSPVGCDGVQHLAAGQVCDLDCAVQRAGHNAHFMDVRHLQVYIQFEEFVRGRALQRLPVSHHCVWHLCDLSMNVPVPAALSPWVLC